MNENVKRFLSGLCVFAGVVGIYFSPVLFALAPIPMWSLVGIVLISGIYNYAKEDSSKFLDSIARAGLAIGSWVLFFGVLDLIRNNLEDKILVFVLYAVWIFASVQLWQKVITPALDKIQKRIDEKK